MKEILNNGESKLSFRTKLNNMFTEIYNYLANLVTKSTDLSDMPNADSLEQNPNTFLKVNDNGDAYELVNLNSKILPDMPSTFVGNALRFLRLNTLATAYELIALSSTDLSDMPASKTGLAGYYLKVNADENAYFLEKSKFIGALDTPTNFTGAANRVLVVNATSNGVVFNTLGKTVTKTWSDGGSNIHVQTFTNGILTAWTVNGV